VEIYEVYNNVLKFKSTLSQDFLKQFVLITQLILPLIVGHIALTVKFSFSLKNIFDYKICLHVITEKFLLINISVEEHQYLGEYAAIFETALTRYSGAQVGLIDKKTEALLRYVQLNG
jgi:hypothetical protein